MIFQSSSLEFHFPSKIDSSIFDVDRTVDMFKNFHSRTIIRFVLSIHRGGGHRFSMDIARGDIVQVSRPFFEDAHSNFLPLPPPPLKWKKFVVSKNRDPCSLIGIGFGRGGSVSGAETLEPTFSPKRVRVTSGKNCEPVFVEEDDRRKETRKHFSKDRVPPSVISNQIGRPDI